MVKYLLAMWETRVQFLGWEDLLEKETATHSSVLAWRIPWTEDPLQYSHLENPMDRGAWWATVHGVTNSRTQLSTHRWRNLWGLWET